jgi:hypothetical protein
VGGLDVLAKAVRGRQQGQQLPEGAQPDAVTPLIQQQQQQQQQSECAEPETVTPLVQLLLLGSEQEATAAVSCSACGSCLLPWLLAKQCSESHLACNRHNNGITMFRFMCWCMYVMYVLYMCRLSRSCRTVRWS